MNRKQRRHLVPAKSNLHGMKVQDAGETLNARSHSAVPSMMLPSFRTSYAIQRGVERKILFHTWGGLGDQACAEPAIRYAIKKFDGCEFYLATPQPDLFSHLKFKRTFNLKEELPIFEDYLNFKSIHDTEHLQWEFVSHMITQAVDYVSINMFRAQLPIEDRYIESYPRPARLEITSQIPEGYWALVHAGRHWQTKTFPKSFWDAVLDNLINLGVTPVLLGANTDDNRGTVDVDTRGCVDLRNQTNLNDMMHLCHETKVLLTNDSSPMHIAASGNAWIGFVATVKHYDYITHYRKEKSAFGNYIGDAMWGWRMKNFGKGGMWDEISFCPNVQSKIEVDKVDPETLAKWLPDPLEYAKWAAEKAKE